MSKFTSEIESRDSDHITVTIYNKGKMFLDVKLIKASYVNKNMNPQKESKTDTITIDFLTNSWLDKKNKKTIEQVLTNCKFSYNPGSGYSHKFDVPVQEGDFFLFIETLIKYLDKSFTF